MNVVIAAFTTFTHFIKCIFLININYHVYNFSSNNYYHVFCFNHMNSTSYILFFYVPLLVEGFFFQLVLLETEIKLFIIYLFTY